MLKIIDITKEYKVEEESILALDRVSIEFRKNEFVSILGPSGCGKTTLLNIIGGLDRYTSGDIQIDGISTKEYDDVDWDSYRNRRVGFVFQSYNLIPHMNILKNVAMSLTLAGVEREERRRRALEALDKVGLAAQYKKKPNQLSGGQMQRVAIARALVNNPEIILADEPTGALDSESGIQVMDLLKEVAEDRLVVMVTHNPMLAEQYSTRIVYLEDGHITGDTMPFTEEDAEAERSEKEHNAHLDAQNEAPVADAEDVKEDVTATMEETTDVEDAQSDAPEKEDADKIENSGKAKKKRRSLKETLNRLRNQEKSSMKLRTAIDLSWTNLLSKKGRTLLTSIAGSIGIIGIILVLSLSNGAGIYINSLEENALSTYPITISGESSDLGSVMSILMESMNNPDTNFDEDTITAEKMLGNIIDMFKDNLLMSHKNDLESFKAYLDKNLDDSLGIIKYQYGTMFNVYAKDPKNDLTYMKVNPFSEMMGKVIDQMGSMGDSINRLLSMLNLDDLIRLAWSEMSDSKGMLESQYQLVGKDQGSRWPTAPNEVVVVVNEYNRIVDYQLFLLGLKSEADVGAAMQPGGDFLADTDYSIEDILSLRYKIMTNADYLELDDPSAPEEDRTWTMHNRLEQDKEFVDEHCVDFDPSDANIVKEVKVVGIVRPKPGTISTSIGGVIGYTSGLTKYLQDYTSTLPAVKEMNKRYEEAVDDGQSVYISPITCTFGKSGGSSEEITAGITEIHVSGSAPLRHTEVMRQLGNVDLSKPTSIEIYCNSFDAKNDVIAFIEEYNSKQTDNSETIQYNDNLSSMMKFIDTMSNTITGVLIAFAAISLVVSTIMIAIIIYTSVLERRKEIGVLRSIGARKKDISRVFLAESAILGGYSGVIGIVVSFVLSLIGSKVLEVVFNISGLMTISWWHCLVMLLISVVLSMMAGFIPSRIAAKKDPAIALRSE